MGRMRFLAAALILLVWTAVPIGTVAAKLLTPHCHCPGHRLPTGPSYAPCSSDGVNVVKAPLLLLATPAATWTALAPGQDQLESYLPPKPGPSARPAVPPPKA